MGRPKKSQSQKNAAKKANAANMELLEKMLQEQSAPENKRMRIGRAGETLKAQVDASKHRAPGSKGEGCAVPSTSGVKPKHAKQLQAEHSGSENKRPCGGRKDQGLKLPEKLNKNQAAGSRNEGSTVPSTSGSRMRITACSDPSGGRMWIDRPIFSWTIDFSICMWHQPLRFGTLCCGFFVGRG
nr:uncharacterized protein LOC115255487 [Aedes albopictus]